MARPKLKDQGTVRIKNTFKTLRGLFLPESGDSKGYAVGKAFISALLAVSLLITAAFAVFFGAESRQRRIASQLRGIMYNESLSAGERSAELKKLNGDYAYWIKCEAANIDLPVYKSSGRFYKNHNADGHYSRYGSLYTQTDSEKCRIVYGNALKNGDMFGSLKNFRRAENYKKSPFIEVFDGDASIPYMVFSIMLIDSREKNGFKYARDSFENFGDFSQWLAEIRDRSILDTGAVAKYGDDLLFLVADADDFRGAKLVAAAYKMRGDEDISSTEGASENPDVLYPDRWYKVHGVEKT